MLYIVISAGTSVTKGGFALRMCISCCLLPVPLHWVPIGNTVQWNIAFSVTQADYQRLYKNNIKEV